MLYSWREKLAGCDENLCFHGQFSFSDLFYIWKLSFFMFVEFRINFFLKNLDSNSYLLLLKQLEGGDLLYLLHHRSQALELEGT